MDSTDRLSDRTQCRAQSSKLQGLLFRPLERCFMNADPKDSDIDDTPEYPLPSPTNPLSRDQRPPDDDTAVEQLPSEEVKRGDVEANPDDPDIAGDDGSSEPS